MTKCLVDEDRLYDNRNCFMTQGIFFETSLPDLRRRHPPSYTLKLKPYHFNGEKLPSAYQIYMESVDEYEAAIKLVGNMSNWERLTRTNWFTKGRVSPAPTHLGLDTWREHKKQKDVSAALEVLKAKSEEGDTNATKALLAEYKKIEKAGRPNKQKNTGSKASPLDKAASSFLTRIK